MTSTIAPTRTTAWWPDQLALAGFAALSLILAKGWLLGFDQAVADWAFANQPDPAYWTARVLNYLGQGGQVLMPVALILTGILYYRTRSIRALFPFAAAFILTYLTIGPAKIFFDRAAPAFDGPDKTILFNPHASGIYAMSYPSGHMGNVLVWYAVFAILLTALLRRPLTRREWLALRVAPVVIVFATTVYLGYHWVTDSVAGVLLGLVLARLLERIPWDALPLPSRGWSRPAGL
ncbi:phosphatase PAP2 family protein [Actinoplanes sp. NBC_00393]|uniref:phosphatase PAP2 family protein n=1 Tax=Actinoplanes sp. NBC_00393 TaxID=2975953 RepID=UPI002E1BBF22